MPANHEWTRVIVLAPPQIGVSAALREAFTARDWFPIEQSDPYLALAELCLRQRAQAARAAWGLQPLERLALVVVEPQDRRPLPELAAAVQRYVPGASVWMAEQNELTLYSSAEAPALATDESRPNAPEFQATGVPDQSPFQQPTAADIPNGDRYEADAESSHRISREEIDMLLELRHGEDDR